MELIRDDEKEGMIMQKDSVRDYITTAFRIYSALGQPDENAINSMNKSIAVKLDLLAVRKTINSLRCSGKSDICKAIEAVYFASPTKKIKRNEIRNRVIAFSIAHYTSERNVWRWLKEGCNICAVNRGLNTARINDIVDDN